MKKISCFLAAVMLFIAMASPFEPASTVHAYSESEISENGIYNNNTFPIEIEQVCDFAYPSSYELQLVKHETGEVVSRVNASKEPTENEDSQKCIVKATMNIPSDFQDGLYGLKIVRTHKGTKSEVYSASERIYTKKTPTWEFYCDVMNDDGFAYAYVYDDNNNCPLKDDSHFPELYGPDKSTKVASFDSFSTENVDGTNVYIYKLKIDDPDAFAMDSTGHTYVYYRMNTKDGSDTVESTQYVLNRSDINGFGKLRVFDFNIYMDKINQSKGGDSKPEKEKTTYRTPVSNAIKQAVAAGGSAEISGITALSYDEMKEISKNPDAKLVMYYTYNDVKYKVIITGKDAVLDPTIPWYGPLYLASKFGNALATAE